MEDDDEHAGLVQRVLERDQHEVRVLLDSKRILEVIKSRKPHIVVTDINMPHFDGINVIEAVKAFDPNNKIIAFTAVGSTV
ncbi:MAG: response regulator [Chloroflexi bacterium]|nr:response regulator [Chloroflexota bacterium]